MAALATPESIVLTGGHYGEDLADEKRSASARPYQSEVQGYDCSEAAPATVGESRKSYMQKRLKDIEEGK